MHISLVDPSQLAFRSCGLQKTQLVYVENNLKMKVLYLVMQDEGEPLPWQDSQKPGNTELSIERHVRARPGKQN